MTGNKIIGVGNGIAIDDAVNKKQLDTVETQVTTINNKVNQNQKDIIKINTNDSHYYLTDQLKHDTDSTVKFPAINSSPYSAVNNSEYLKITRDGHYQIIYQDFYKENGTFIIHDDTNGNDLFTLNLNTQSDWVPITINTIIPITVDNGFNYARIKMYIKTSYGAVLDGAGYSTFYIIYLHP